MSHIVRNKGKSTGAYTEVREDTFVLQFLYYMTIIQIFYLKE